MTSHIKYTGDLRVHSIHLKSHETIISDAPTDNNGKGQAFSPTDLVATALGKCIITIVGIKARDMGLNIDNSTLEVTKIMASNPRRISEINILVNMAKGNFSTKDKKILEAAGRACPVAKSLHPDLSQNIIFNWL